jgi:hypothetical protein
MLGWQRLHCIHQTGSFLVGVLETHITRTEAWNLPTFCSCYFYVHLVEDIHDLVICRVQHNKDCSQSTCTIIARELHWLLCLEILPGKVCPNSRNCSFKELRSIIVEATSEASKIALGQPLGQYSAQLSRSKPRQPVYHTAALRRLPPHCI